MQASQDRMVQSTADWFAQWLQGYDRPVRIRFHDGTTVESENRPSPRMTLVMRTREAFASLFRPQLERSLGESYIAGDGDGGRSTRMGSARRRESPRAVCSHVGSLGETTGTGTWASGGPRGRNDVSSVAVVSGCVRLLVSKRTSERVPSVMRKTFRWSIEPAPHAKRLVRSFGIRQSA